VLSGGHPFRHQSCRPTRNNIDLLIGSCGTPSGLLDCSWGSKNWGAQAGGILSKYYERPRDVEGEANKRAALGKQIEGWRIAPEPVAGGGSAGTPTKLPNVNVTAPAGPRMPTAAEPLPGGGAGPQSLNLDLGNSRHEVFIDVRGPKGMRTGLARAEGPAEVAVRTHYPMDDLS
jgi:hypothetical protein